MAENEKKTGIEKSADKKPAKAEKQKSDKPSVWKRIASWFRSVRSESKKVSWANRKTVQNNTIIVIVCVLACSIVLGILDYLFNSAIVGLGMLI